MFKNKRKFSIALVVAMVLSLVPSFAFAATPKEGKHVALFENTASSNHKISMAEVGTDYYSYTDSDGKAGTDGNGEISATVSGDVITAHIAFCLYGNTVTHVCLEADLPNGFAELSKADKEAALEAAAKAVVDEKSVDIVIPGDGTTFGLYYKTSSGWKADKKQTVKVSLDKTNDKIKSSNIISGGHAISVRITRHGNVSDAKYVGAEIKNKYGVSKIEDGHVFVTIEGGFTKMFLGNYSDAEAAEKSSKESDKKKVIALAATDGKVTLDFDRPPVGDKLLVSMYSGSMDKWLDYEFAFTSKVCDHSFNADGICTKCGAVSTTGNAFKMTDDAVEIKSESNTTVMLPKEITSAFKEAEKPVEITSKAGSITFDKTAINAIFGGKTFVDDVKFEMKDLKSDPAYADSEYDIILDLTLEDAFGNNLFAEGTNGKATITVPYDKEVPEGKTVKVFYITESGKNEVEATYDPETKTVTFVVEHFSTYGIEQADAAVEENAETVVKSPQTGDNNGLLALFAGLMLLSGAVLVTSKKYAK